MERLRNVGMGDWNSVQAQSAKAADEAHRADMMRINAERAQRNRVDDAVNSPKHYEVLPGVDVKDIIEATLTPEEYRGWVKGNEIKYTLRADKKGKPIEDRNKARWMADEVIRLLRKP